MHVLRFGNKLNKEVCHRFIFENLFNLPYLHVRLWWRIPVANLATNFQDLVAKVKNLVALVPVLGTISGPECTFPWKWVFPFAYYSDEKKISSEPSVFFLAHVEVLAPKHFDQRKTVSTKNWNDRSQDHIHTCTYNLYREEVATVCYELRF